MASRLGSISRPVAAFLRSAAVAAAAARRPTSTPHSSASHALPRIPRPAARGRRTGLARSLQPLHSALSAARLASRLGPGEAGVARAMSQGCGQFLACHKIYCRISVHPMLLRRRLIVALASERPGAAATAVASPRVRMASASDRMASPSRRHGRDAASQEQGRRHTSVPGGKMEGGRERAREKQVRGGRGNNGIPGYGRGEAKGGRRSGDIGRRAISRPPRRRLPPGLHVAASLRASTPPPASEAPGLHAAASLRASKPPLHLLRPPSPAMLLEGTHESCIILLGRRAKSTNNGQCHQEMGLNVPR